MYCAKMYTMDAPMHFNNRQASVNWERTNQIVSKREFYGIFLYVWAIPKMIRVVRQSAAQEPYDCRLRLLFAFMSVFGVKWPRRYLSAYIPSLSSLVTLSLLRFSYLRETKGSELRGSLP